MGEARQFGRLGISQLQPVGSLFSITKLTFKTMEFLGHIVDPPQAVDFLSRNRNLMLLAGCPEPVPEEVLAHISEFPDEVLSRDSARQKQAFVRDKSPRVAPSERDHGISDPSARRVHVIDGPGMHLQSPLPHFLLKG